MGVCFVRVFFFVRFFFLVYSQQERISGAYVGKKLGWVLDRSACALRVIVYFFVNKYFYFFVKTGLGFKIAVRVRVRLCVRCV